MTTFTPTAEQRDALRLFETGESLAIEAGAGTGKTSTLRLVADSTDRSGQYLAFNKAIVQDAAAAFPDSVACNTAHSLAYRACGFRYKRRLNGRRIRNEDVARILGIDPFVATTNAGSKRLAPGYLAGLVMRSVSIFATTADAAPGSRHVPYVEGIDLPHEDGSRGWENNERLRRAMLPHVEAAWADLQRDDRDGGGQLRFGHDIYLKLWQLSGPRIQADYILFDEAQDANPVMLDIVRQQTHAQLVFVGDSQQAIYGFTGAVNALANVPADNRTYLTQSFRFGDAIASAANRVLSVLDADLRLRGLSSLPSTVAAVEKPDVILTRTNAKAVEIVLAALARGERPALVGGAEEVVRFAEAARDLQEGRPTSHPELACFASWGEVQAYVDNDEMGGDLRLLVRLCDDFGPEKIITGLGRTVREDSADVIVSTAHKSKGREWDTVRIADDFPDLSEDPSPEELRLLYVAVTRARRTLDVKRVAFFGERGTPTPGASAPLPIGAGA